MPQTTYQPGRTQKIDLGGTDWKLSETTAGGVSDAEVYAATVPGCVHTDLLACDVICDPWPRDQEKDIHWVWKKDWTYSRIFEIDEKVLAKPRVELQCEGLDTFAAIKINGRSVGETENMFRRYAFDIKPYLQAGRNEIVIAFASPEGDMVRRDGEKRLPAWNLFHKDFFGKSYVRKMACAFGWDWGPMAPTAGVWRPIRIVASDGFVEDLRVVQKHAEGRVVLEVSGEIVGGGDKVRINVGRTGGGAAEVAGGGSGSGGVACECGVNEGRFAGVLEIREPALWWPNQMGEQALYAVSAELVSGGGEVLDWDSRRIGLRTVELVQEPDEFGTSFRFRVNGKDVFAKGANWIPCDVFPSRISDHTYRDLLESAAESGMNMIRVWGGGIYEDARFYEGCDELGIFVWQDFMFACSTYPTFDPAFVANVEAEAIDNIKRLRHHPSLALWCGNNELEQGLVRDTWTEGAMSWEDYKPLFDDLLEKLVAQEDGVTPYWPSSPHTPEVDVCGVEHNRIHHNDETVGDAHAWSVWFGGQPFEAQRDWVFRFMSEFGFQSFPEPRTVESYTDPEDRHLTSWIMDYHQRSGPGNQTIYKYMLEWFCPPKDFDSTLWLTQITQALCIEYAADHARRLQGRMDGLLYWQLNDIWPGATWASIDVYGRWKALQYFAKRFFAPVRVSLVESVEDGKVGVYVSNQGPEGVGVTVRWSVMTGGGEVLGEGGEAVSVDPQSCVGVETIACQDLREGGGVDRLPLEVRSEPFAPISGDRDLFVFAWVVDESGKELSRTMATFAKPKHLLLRDPGVAIQLVADDEAGTDDEIVLRITSDVPAPWTRLEIVGTDARPSDNFVHLFPGQDAYVSLPAGALGNDTGEASRLERIRAVPLVEMWRS